MPNFGYGGTYNPVYDIAAQKSPYVTKFQENGPQPQAESPFMPPSPIDIQKSPYSIGSDFLGDVTRSQLGQSDLSPSSLGRAGLLPSYAGVNFYSGINPATRRFDINQNLYQQIGSKVSGWNANQLGAAPGQAGYASPRLASFEDIRNRFKLDLYQNAPMTQDTGAWGTSAREREKYLLSAYEDFAKKARATGMFGQGGRFIQGGK